MNKTLILTASLLLLTCALSASGTNDTGTTRDGLLTFIEPNVGQTDADYTHVARANGYMAFLRADQARFLLGAAEQAEAKLDGEISEDLPRHTLAKRSDVRMQLLDANAGAAGTPGGMLTGHSNYLYGSDSQRWLTGVPHFSTLQFADVYPGIDVVYTLESSALRYDFVLAPRADASDIRLRFDGAETVRLNDSGDLVVRVGEVEMVHSSPKIFQRIDGAQRDVAGGFVVEDDGTLQFRVAAHDPDMTLVIDPQVTLSTYLGGSASDGAQDITVDASNRIVVVGATASLNFPGATVIGPTPTGTDDIFVARFAADGQSLEFATYIGGSGVENPHQVEVDANGNILLAGYTSSPDFPTLNALQSVFVGGGGFDSDGFVTKLDPTGASLVYSTYLGGSGPLDPQFGFEWVRGLTVDAAGNAYVVGETSAADFPANAVVEGRACMEGEAGAISTFIGDAFVAKLTPTGSLVFAACIGGAERDTGRGIALAVDGAIHIVGFTRSADYPVSAGAFQTQLAVPASGAYDVHVTRLDPSGFNIDWSSFVGGSDTEFAQQIRVAADSSSIVVGTSFSNDFPTSAGAYQPSRADSVPFTDDGIVFRLSAGGSTMMFGTYLGGAGRDAAWGLDLDENERIYVSGSTESLDFPQVNPTQSSRGAPASAVATIPGTDDTRSIAVGQVLVNGVGQNLLVAANAVQSRAYELDLQNAVQNVVDLGLPTDDSVAVAMYDADFDLLADGFIVANRGAASRAYFTDGVGGYLPPVDLAPSSSAASAVAVGSLVGTGEPDVVIGNNLAANVVYPGAVGGFGPGEMIMPGSENTATLSLAIGDVNQDGFADVVEGNQGINMVYFGSVSGLLSGVPLGGESAASTAVTLGDMDNDGDLDVVVGNNGAPNRLYRNMGGGTFAFLQDLDFNVATTQGLTLVDLNSDGTLDVVTADAANGAAYINDGFGQFTLLPLSSASASATAIAQDLQVGAYRANAGGAIDVLSLGLSDVYLAVLDPSGRELLFSSYLGGGGIDRSEWGLFVQNSANVYLAGNTSAMDFPTVAPFQSQLSGGSDAFITRFAMDDLVSPTPSATYETVIDFGGPTVDGVTHLVFNWSTLGCGESGSDQLYSLEMLLLADGQIVYSDAVIRDGILQPFRGLQRVSPFWDFDLATMTLRQFNQGTDALIGLPEAFGTNYLVTDADSLPADGVVSLLRFDDGVFIGGGLSELVSQTTLLVAGDCDADGVDASVDNCQNVANANQRDTNGDNIGNACDADLNNDCTVNVVDLGILRNVFFTNDADADFNGDGTVNISDLGILRSTFFGTPGPSGVPNACQ